MNRLLLWPSPLCRIYQGHQGMYTEERYCVWLYMCMCVCACGIWHVERWGEPALNQRRKAS
jgi:hypothetical protein